MSFHGVYFSSIFPQKLEVVDPYRVRIVRDVDGDAADREIVHDGFSIYGYLRDAAKQLFPLNDVALPDITAAVPIGTMMKRYDPKNPATEGTPVEQFQAEAALWEKVQAGHQGLMTEMMDTDDNLRMLLSFHGLTFKEFGASMFSREDGKLEFLVSNQEGPQAWAVVLPAAVKFEKLVDKVVKQNAAAADVAKIRRRKLGEQDILFCARYVGGEIVWEDSEGTQQRLTLAPPLELSHNYASFLQELKDDFGKKGFVVRDPMVRVVENDSSSDDEDCFAAFDRLDDDKQPEARALPQDHWSGYSMADDSRHYPGAAGWGQDTMRISPVDVDRYRTPSAASSSSSKPFADAPWRRLGAVGYSAPAMLGVEEVRRKIAQTDKSANGSWIVLLRESEFIAFARSVQCGLKARDASASAKAVVEQIQCYLMSNPLSWDQFADLINFKTGDFPDGDFCKVAQLLANVKKERGLFRIY